MTQEEFIEFLFNRPDEGPEWYWSDDFVEPNLAAAVAVEYTNAIFSGLSVVARPFNQRQICMGLNYLTNPSCGNHPYLLIDTSVPELRRVELISSMFDVFSFFNTRCIERLEHTDPGDQKVLNESMSYNYVCYMWWHVFPRHGIPARTDFAGVDDAILQVMSKMLSLSSIACKEAALHGLGHWHAAVPERIEAIVDAARSSLPKTLDNYAVDARAGRVQ